MLKSKPNLRGGNSDFEPIPEGVYTAQIIDVNEVSWFNSFSGEDVDGFEYKFAILDDEELPESGDSTRGRFLWWRVTNSLNKKSNLYKLATTALKRKLTDEELDTDSDTCFNPEDIVGMQLMVVVEQNESKDGRVFSNIASVTMVKTELEPVEYEVEETQTVTKKSTPVKKTPLEEEMEEDEDPIENEALDDIIKETIDDEEEEEEEVEEEEEEEEEDEDLAEYKAEMLRAKKRLAEKKAEKKSAKPVKKVLRKTTE